jgi:hypothetical protein
MWGCRIEVVLTPKPSDVIGGKLACRRCFYQARSSAIAIPCPTPMHIVESE